MIGIKFENKVFLAVALIAVTFLSLSAYKQITGGLSVQLPQQQLRTGLNIDPSLVLRNSVNALQSEVNALRTEVQQLRERIARLEQQVQQQSNGCSNCQSVFRTMLGSCQQVTTASSDPCATACQRSGKACVSAYITSYRTSDGSQFVAEPVECSSGRTFGSAFTARAHCSCC